MNTSRPKILALLLVSGAAVVSLPSHAQTIWCTRTPVVSQATGREALVEECRCSGGSAAHADLRTSPIVSMGAWLIRQ
jgi:hypothetical protein